MTSGRLRRVDGRHHAVEKAADSVSAAVLFPYAASECDGDWPMGRLVVLDRLVKN